VTVDVHDLAEQLAPLIAEHATPSLLDADQAGELLNVPSSWVMAQARSGRIPHCKLGHYTRFDRDELLAWVDGRTVGPRRKATR
jgi:excisionase family DNA binding protein